MLAKKFYSKIKKNLNSNNIFYTNNGYNKTFKDLYTFLQNFEENNILNWLETPWVGKEKQESLLRLFTGLGLIDKLKLLLIKLS